MLLIVHNLPKEITSLDVRQLIQEQCGLREVILDNLVDEGPGKRITVGLAEEEDAVILMQKLNGLHYKKCQLYIEDVRKKKSIAPTYSMLIPAGLQPQTSKSWIQYPTPNTAPQLKPLNQNNMPYYMTQDSNNTNFGRPTQSTHQNTSIFNRNYQYPLNATFQTPKANDLWEYPLTSSNTNKNQGSVDPHSFKGYQNDRDKQGDRRDNTTQPNWRVNKSSPSKRHENFDNFSERETRFGDKNSKRNKLRDDPRRRDDDRSPPRGRNLLRENKDDRRDDFNSSERSRSNLWNPHDKGTCTNERQSDREQNSVFGRQRSSFDQDERKNDQKRNYEQRDCSPRENILRPRSPRDNVLKRDRPSTNVFGNTSFSINPGNSSFTKSNRSIFDKIVGSREFGETSQNKVYNSNQKLDNSKSKANISAPKRARFEPPTQHFDNKKFINPNIPTDKATDKQKIMTRYTNWCNQSASLLAKEVLKNASRSKIDSAIFKSVFKKLRECIMSRLDVILGDKMANSLSEISRAYRTKFDNRDDIAFFKAVMEKVERENEENSDEITGPKITSEKQHQEIGKLTKGPTIPNPFYSQTANVNKEKKQQNQESVKLNKEGPSFVVNPYSTPKSQSTPKPNIAASVKQKTLISQNLPKIPFNKYTPTTPRLPKYPNSDKKGHRNFKKTALLEFEEGFFTLEPELEKAIDDEVDKLVECYVKACEPSSNKLEDTIRNKIITSTTDEFKKIIKLDVTKRVLNVTEGLTVRILCSPKPPPKALLDAFLKRHGAISLKKSDTTRMFVANCDSYENYDRLIALQTAGLGSVTLYIKPYQLMGPVTKSNKKSNQTLIKPGLEDFTKDVDETKIDLTNDLINDDPDVMLIENDASEVVVIRDELDKSINSQSDKVVNNDEINDLKAFNDDSNDKVDDCIAKIAASNIEVAAANVKVAVSNQTSDKIDNSNVRVDIINEKVNTNDKVNNSDAEMNTSKEKVDNSDNDSIERVDNCDAEVNNSNDNVDNSNAKVNNSNDNVDNSNAKVNNSNDNVDNSNDKVKTSNEKIATSDPKINVFNEKGENIKVNISNDKIEDSSDDQHSQTKEEIDKCEKITPSLDDILNDASEILDDDLEDF